MGNPLMNLFNLPQNMQLPPQLLSLIKIMKNGGNMESAINMLLEQCPEAKSILTLMKGGQTPHSLEQACRIACQQKGLNFDELYKQAQNIISQN